MALVRHTLLLTDELARAYRSTGSAPLLRLMRPQRAALRYICNVTAINIQGGFHWYDGPSSNNGKSGLSKFGQTGSETPHHHPSFGRQTTKSCDEMLLCGIDLFLELCW